MTELDEITGEGNLASSEVTISTAAMIDVSQNATGITNVSVCITSSTTPKLYACYIPNKGSRLDQPK